MPNLTLSLLQDAYAVCRFPPMASVATPPRCAFSVLIQAADETTLVCPQDLASQDLASEEAQIELGWRCLRIEQAFDFSVAGILASVLQPLADAKIGIFASSTFSTDYVLVKARDLERAIAALTGVGHAVRR